MKNRVFAYATAVACLPAVAVAEYDLAWDGMIAHEAIHYSLDNSASWDAEARARNSFAFAGLLGFNDGALKLFCIELQQQVTHDAIPYEVGPFDSSDVDLDNRTRVLASLFDNWYENVVTTESDAMAAAFAMVTWEIMTERFSGDANDILMQVDLDRGAAQFGDYSIEASAIADEMMLQLFVASDSSSLLRYSSSTHQDFVGQVPAPVAVALLGVAGVIGRRRRRN
jgi:MYXO-CTERM domain-containing protein